MSEKKTPQKAVGLQSGELQTLRQILYGEQAESFDHQLEALAQHLEATDKNLAAVRDDLQQQITDLRNLMLDQVVAELRVLIEALEKQKTSRMDLGDMLIEMGQRLQSSNDDSG